jgi:osmoprotectant transport system ATP-binding protein
MHDVGVEFAKVSYALASGKLLLRDVSLRLEPGTTTALLGRSGSGKTTLLRMVNAMALPTGGEVRVGGKATSAWDRLLLRRGIGYVIQESGLFPHRTAAWNAGLALELAGKRDDARTAEVLALVGLDASFGERMPWQLSGGQRQRVGLARALANDPAVLLMDEPFGALDPITRAEMQTMLRDLLARVRKTVLLVTHDLDEALYLAQRVVFVDAGEIVADLASSEVPGSDHEKVKAYVRAVHRVTV